MDVVKGRVLVPGTARGPVLAMAAPISFWGGVDPASGIVCDPRHPDHGRSLVGQVAIIPSTVGSSSSSAIMLELLRGRRAPAALILGSVDPILTLGVVIAREMGYGTIPVVAVGRDALDRLPQAGMMAVDDGALRWSA